MHEALDATKDLPSLVLPQAAPPDTGGPGEPDPRRLPKTHFLKTWPQYFRAVRDGRKPFELRRDDRDFQSGDTVHLEEWDPDANRQTGEFLTRHIGYLARGGVIPAGYCVFALEPTTPTGPTELDRLRGELEEARRGWGYAAEQCTRANERAEKAEAARETWKRIARRLARRAYNWRANFRSVGADNAANIEARQKAEAALAAIQAIERLAATPVVTASGPPTCKAVCAGKTCGEPLILMCPRCSAIPDEPVAFVTASGPGEEARITPQQAREAMGLPGLAGPTEPWVESDFEDPGPDCQPGAHLPTCREHGAPAPSPAVAPLRPAREAKDIVCGNCGEVIPGVHELAECNHDKIARDAVMADRASRPADARTASEKVWDAIEGLVSEVRAERPDAAEVGRLRKELAEERRMHGQTIDARDRREEQVEAVAVELGCENEWTNLHDHGVCALENAAELRAALASLRTLLEDGAGLVEKLAVVTADRLGFEAWARQVREVLTCKD